MSISTCALREEGDCVMAFSSGVMRYFYPRPPRGRRRENIQCEAKLLAISIHALREEGDADRLEITTHCAIIGFYSKLEGADTRKYLAWFTAANVAMVAVLVATYCVLNAL